MLRRFATPSTARLCSSALRSYSSAQPPKPSAKLVGELRKLTETSISKARDALIATSNDLNAALKWLEEDLAVSGAKKAAKVEGRTAGEGLVGVSILSPGLGSWKDGIRASMVELNCETDFVARNELFSKLLADISHTTAFLAEEPHPDSFEQHPVLLREYQGDSFLDAPPHPQRHLHDSFQRYIRRNGYTRHHCEGRRKNCIETRRSCRYARCYTKRANR